MFSLKRFQQKQMTDKIMTVTIKADINLSEMSFKVIL